MNDRQSQRRPVGAWTAVVLCVAALSTVLGPVVVFGANSTFLATSAACLQAVACLLIMLALRDTVAAFWIRLAPAGALFAILLAIGAAETAALAGRAPERQAMMAVELVKMGGAGAVFLMFALLGNERGRLRWLLAAFAVCGGTYALLSLWAYQLDPTHVFGVSKGLRFGRFTGTLLNANVAGCLFGVFGIVSLGWLQRLAEARRWTLAGTAALMLMLCIGAVVQTRSRTAFVLTTSAVLLLVAVLLLRRQGSPPLAKAIVAGVGGVSLAVAIVAATQGLFSRFSVLGADWDTRMDSFAIYAKLSGQAPLWGFGPGSFTRLHAQQLTPDNATLLWNFNAAHCAPLQFWVEAGPVRAALLLGAVIYLAVFVTSSRGRPRDLQSLSGILALGLIIASSLVDIALNVPAVAALAAALGGLIFGASAAPYASNAPILRRNR
jgi:O-antigen ligase